MTTNQETSPITETTAYLLGRLDERQEAQGKQLDAIQAEQKRQFEAIQAEQSRQGKVLAVIEEKVESYSREHAESATGRRWLIRVGLVGAGIAATLAIQILPNIIQMLQTNP